MIAWAVGSDNVARIASFNYQRPDGTEINWMDENVLDEHDYVRVPPWALTCRWKSYTAEEAAEKAKRQPRLEKNLHQ